MLETLRKKEQKAKAPKGKGEAVRCRAPLRAALGCQPELFGAHCAAEGACTEAVLSPGGGTQLCQQSLSTPGGVPRAAK